MTYFIHDVRRLTLIFQQYADGSDQ